MEVNDEEEALQVAIGTMVVTCQRFEGLFVWLVRGIVRSELELDDYEPVSDKDRKTAPKNLLKELCKSNCITPEYAQGLEEFFDRRNFAVHRGEMEYLGDTAGYRHFVEEVTCMARLHIVVLFGFMRKWMAKHGRELTVPDGFDQIFKHLEADVPELARPYRV